LPALFFKNCGKGRYPRAKTPRDKLERKLLKLSTLKPADASVAAEIDGAMDVIEIATAALDRQSGTETGTETPSGTKPPPGTKPGTKPAGVTETLGVTETVTESAATSVTPTSGHEAPVASTPVASTPLFFTDARQIESGYRPRAPRSERERIENEIRVLQARRWSDPDERREIDSAIEALEQQLNALPGGGT
jgi:hypothetical protein